MHQHLQKTNSKFVVLDRTVARFMQLLDTACKEVEGGIVSASGIVLSYTEKGMTTMHIKEACSPNATCSSLPQLVNGLEAYQYK